MLHWKSSEMINETNNNFNINNRLLQQHHPNSDNQSTCSSFVIR